MQIPKFINRENMYNFVSFLSSSIISVITYIQQSHLDVRLMIIANSIAIIIISISIFLVYSMKIQRQKLQAEHDQLIENYDKISTHCISARQNEPISTPRDTFVVDLIQYLSNNRINNIYHNKPKNQIELSLV